jgi:medium-chain acyl-[acyl-carrier-protein] hydrolase
MPQHIELCAVQLPGRETRLGESLCCRMDALIDDLSFQLKPHLDRPYAFFGHSMGALVSYELVRRLGQEFGTVPLHLFLSGRGGPHCPPDREPVYQLSDSDLVAYVRTLGGTPTEVLHNEELLALTLPVIRADFELLDTYVPPTTDVHLECPVTVFGGTADATVSTSQLRAWAGLARARFGMQLFEGDHFYLHANVEHLTRLIVAELMLA